MSCDSGAIGLPTTGPTISGVFCFVVLGECAVDSALWRSDRGTGSPAFEQSLQGCEVRTTRERQSPTWSLTFRFAISALTGSTSYHRGSSGWQAHRPTLRGLRCKQRSEIRLAHTRIPKILKHRIERCDRHLGRRCNLNPDRAIIV